MDRSTHRQASRPRLHGVALVVLALLGALLAWVPQAAAADCTGPGTCLPDGVLVLTFTKTGDPSCQFNATVSWGDGSPSVRLTNIANAQTVQHTYQPGQWTASVTGSGSSPDPSVTCTFTPGTVPVEVPLPDGLPPACSETGEPAGCVFTIGVSKTHLTPEMKANYADGSRKLLEQIDRTEKLLTFPCTPVKVTRDIVKKGLKEVIKNLPAGVLKKWAKKVLDVPDVCSSPTKFLSDKARESAQRYQRLAEDPPDDEYMRVPSAFAEKAPSFGKGGLGKRLRAYAWSVSRLEARLQALVQALERAQGADQAADEPWTIMLSVSAAELALLSADGAATQIAAATQLRASTVAFTKSDVRGRQAALSGLKEHKAAVIKALDGAVSASRFWTALKKTHYDVPARFPQTLTAEIVGALTAAGDSVRLWGETLDPAGRVGRPLRAPGTPSRPLVIEIRTGSSNGCWCIKGVGGAE
jgi:hypothetical protein